MSPPFIEFPGGGVAHVCVRGRRPKACAHCGRFSSVLCDGRVQSTKLGKPKLCSKPLCRTCAESRGPNFDLCPSCAKATPKQLELGSKP